ncbi:RNA polymerase, sigma-24 subunit, ECF subfamily [Beutenbergia cavernae DSM 12333]|uniref:RNA polymerase, sigma-24 subunit, ECF subfamily n=1 Tax=Beutenbergia cavernae (strain ATCC BAA-8 / DSM 12333 / CCUG 43141 / JCM 11478 / NBRC 16432 / NCIMB 13614 / HKI 0122) TaxID=471853 RepID=C5C2T2_BEUC1|nr:SigE family RNA polymerase sigma factor [Beutenbergia cavernae]ACQ81776.1 RNA polymerase, sigma-24 subunit, ECF subfamily [Beutenbergia cavernae DSM 12333]
MTGSEGVPASGSADEPGVAPAAIEPHGGRDAEFTAFVELHGDALGRTAWLLCGDAHRAEELVQETLVRTYVHWHRARAGEPLAYARRVLANLRIDTWRARRRETLRGPETMPERASDDGGAAVVEDRAVLAAALARLTPRQRRAVVLRYFLGLPEADVARDLRVSVGTVKSTTSRALAVLRGHLEPEREAGRTS